MGRNKAAPGTELTIVELPKSQCPSWVDECDLVATLGRGRVLLAVEMATAGVSDQEVIEGKLTQKYGRGTSDGKSGCLASSEKATNHKWTSNGLLVKYWPYGDRELIQRACICRMPTLNLATQPARGLCSVRRMATRTTNSNGIKIISDDYGTGEHALVCMPGWCNPRSFMAPLAEHLGKKHRVLNIDWRGHGDTPDSPTDFTTEDVLADLDAVFTDAGVKTITPICLANAGWFALEYARRNPGRVSKMVSLTWSLCELPAFFKMTIDGLQDKEMWEDIRDMFFGMWFQHADPDFIAWVRDQMGRFDFDMWSRSGREIGSVFDKHKSPVALINALPQPLRVLHLFSRPGLPDEWFEMHNPVMHPQPWYSEVVFDEPWAIPSYQAPEALSKEIEAFLCG